MILEWIRQHKTAVVGIIVAVVLIAVVATGAISVTMSAMDELRTMSKTATSSQKKLDQALEARNMAQRATISKRQQRLMSVENIATLFTPAAPKSAWVNEVHTGSNPAPAPPPSFVDRVCGEVDRFWQTDRALKVMRPGSGSGISWEELGVAKATAEKMHWDVGITAARSVFGAFQAPRKDREGDGCGNLSFLEPLTIGDEIMIILVAINGDPKNIGSSTAHLRQWVLYDLRARLTEMRAEGSADAQANIIAMAKAAMRGVPWKYTATELALTADEAKAAEPPKKG